MTDAQESRPCTLGGEDKGGSFGVGQMLAEVVEPGLRS